MLVFAEEVSIENDFKGTKKLKIFFLKEPLRSNQETGIDIHAMLCVLL